MSPALANAAMGTIACCRCVSVAASREASDGVVVIWPVSWMAVDWAHAAPMLRNNASAPIRAPTFLPSAVLVIGHFLHPVHVPAVEHARHREVRHRAVRRGAVPVLDAGR